MQNTFSSSSCFSCINVLSRSAESRNKTFMSANCLVCNMDPAMQTQWNCKLFGKLQHNRMELILEMLKPRNLINWIHGCMITRVTKKVSFTLPSFPHPSPTLGSFRLPVVPSASTTSCHVSTTASAHPVMSQIRAGLYQHAAAAAVAQWITPTLGHASATFHQFLFPAPTSLFCQLE